MKSAQTNDPTEGPEVRRSGPGRKIAGGVAVLVLTGLVGLRAAAEYRMMDEFGSDPQLGIWWMFMLVKLVFWIFSGMVLAVLLIVLWRKHVGRIVVLVLCIAWATWIVVASWQYERGRKALADADDPATSPERLRELAHFDGIQSGYRLDNRVARHANTSPDVLRELYGRDQQGTDLVLARNPHTPKDILDELSQRSDEWIRRSLASNPSVPETALRRLERSTDEEVQRRLANRRKNNGNRRERSP